MTRMPALEDLIQEDELPVGATLLNGQYEITQQLRRGGFGITYVARNSLDRAFVIKECFPTDMCRRVAGIVEPVDTRFDRALNAVRRQFVLEARRMAKLEHPNIVGVHQVFEENNTAYMALDLVAGDDLIDLAETHPERLTPAFVSSILEQMLRALTYTHSHAVLHRDISPDNILVDDQGHVTLIDFGAASEPAGISENGKSRMIAVKDGYSPHEFYTPGAEHDFSSDLYALGATLFRIISGETAPDCQTRLRAVAMGHSDPLVPLAGNAPAFDARLLETIDRAMQITQADRFRSADAWRAALEGTGSSTPARTTPVPTDPMLETRISELVTQINTEIEPALRAEAEAKSAPEETETVPVTRTVVDIFGNPIDDVDAWLQEQEQQAMTSAPLVEAAEAPAPEPQEQVQQAPRKSLLGKIVSRCMSSKTT
ncbi:serine/threonine-protein kinase [uncultured Roseobacter sp.]|uniref:serine/threonine protein kinase n=1 Tax=uncultured Roseobacter sp. TaxID=114847 RepID=UPI00261BC5F1|nr:serine/threonine-protein kinase [uncultured Roseobacter sp.]